MAKVVLLGAPCGDPAISLYTLCFSHQADAIFREYVINKGDNLLTPPFKL